MVAAFRCGSRGAFCFPLTRSRSERAIGAIAGGAKGALLGGPIGAGAGTAAAYFAGKRDVKLPVETYLNFKLTEPLTVDSHS